MFMDGKSWYYKTGNYPQINLISSTIPLKIPKGFSWNLTIWIQKKSCGKKKAGSRRAKIFLFLLKKVKICLNISKVQVITIGKQANRQSEWDIKVRSKFILYGHVLYGRGHITNHRKRTECSLNGSETTEFLHGKIKLKTK